MAPFVLLTPSLGEGLGLFLEKIRVFVLSSELSTSTKVFVGLDASWEVDWLVLMNYRSHKIRELMHTCVEVVFLDFFFFLGLVVVEESGSRF